MWHGCALAGFRLAPFVTMIIAMINMSLAGDVQKLLPLLLRLLVHLLGVAHLLIGWDLLRLRYEANLLAWSALQQVAKVRIVVVHIVVRIDDVVLQLLPDHVGGWCLFCERNV